MLPSCLLSPSALAHPHTSPSSHLYSSKHPTPPHIYFPLRIHISISRPKLGIALGSPFTLITFQTEPIFFPLNLFHPGKRGWLWAPSAHSPRSRVGHLPPPTVTTTALTTSPLPTSHRGYYMNPQVVSLPLASSPSDLPSLPWLPECLCCKMQI